MADGYFVKVNVWGGGVAKLVGKAVQDPLKIAEGGEGGEGRGGGGRLLRQGASLGGGDGRGGGGVANMVGKAVQDSLKIAEGGEGGRGGGVADGYFVKARVQEEGRGDCRV